MNTPTLLAFISLFAFGVGSFLWKVAGANQAYGPSYMIVEGITFALVGFIIHLIHRHPFVLSSRMTGFAIFGGILAGIAVFSLLVAFNLGGSGSTIFPISRLAMVVSVVLAFIIYHEPVTATKLVGLGLGISSIIVLSR